MPEGNKKGTHTLLPPGMKGLKTYVYSIKRIKIYIKANN